LTQIHREAIANLKIKQMNSLPASQTDVQEWLQIYHECPFFMLKSKQLRFGVHLNYGVVHLVYKITANPMKLFYFDDVRTQSCPRVGQGVLRMD